MFTIKTFNPSIRIINFFVCLYTPIPCFIWTLEKRPNYMYRSFINYEIIIYEWVNYKNN